MILQSGRAIENMEQVGIEEARAAFWLFLIPTIIGNKLGVGEAVNTFRRILGTIWDHIHTRMYESDIRRLDV